MTNHSGAIINLHNIF